jgi:hypothetical protein
MHFGCKLEIQSFKKERVQHCTNMCPHSPLIFSTACMHTKRLLALVDNPAAIKKRRRKKGGKRKRKKEAAHE